MVCSGVSTVGSIETLRETPYNEHILSADQIKERQWSYACQGYERGAGRS